MGGKKTKKRIKKILSWIEEAHEAQKVFDQSFVKAVDIDPSRINTTLPENEEPSPYLALKLDREFKSDEEYKQEMELIGKRRAYEKQQQQHEEQRVIMETNFINSLPSWYDYDPLPSIVRLDKSTIHGYGVFAVGDIQKGLTIGFTHKNYGGNNIDRTPLGGYLNHGGLNHNCRLIKTNVTEFGKPDHFAYILAAVRHIHDGEELTLNYHDQKNICKPNCS